MKSILGRQGGFATKQLFVVAASLQACRIYRILARSASLEACRHSFVAKPSPGDSFGRAANSSMRKRGKMGVAGNFEPA